MYLIIKITKLLYIESDIESIKKSFNKVLIGEENRK